MLRDLGRYDELRETLLSFLQKHSFPFLDIMVTDDEIDNIFEGYGIAQSKIRDGTTKRDLAIYKLKHPGEYEWALSFYGVHVVDTYKNNGREAAINSDVDATSN